VEDAYPVPEPVGPAPRQRLPDGRQPERLAGVDGEVRVLALEVFERVEMTRRREPRLGAGDVEPDDAGFPMRHDQLGDLPRPGRLAHRRQQRPDPDGPDRKSTRLNSSHVKISYAAFCLTT